MNIEEILPNGDTRREVWHFWFDSNVSGIVLYLADYSFQTRNSRRHKWRKQTYWSRLDKRDNSIDNPPLPPRIKVQARQQIMAAVEELSVTV